MDAKPVVPGLWQVKIRYVNAFLFDTGAGLALIDTGMPGSAGTIREALRTIGKQASDIRHLFVTHCHPDHAGSLAALKRLTGAPATMHPADAALVRQGVSSRPLKPAPGVFNAAICQLFLPSKPKEIERTEIEHPVEEGAVLPGGLRAIHVPGHCAGQLAFHWPEHGGVLIAADAAAHVFGLALSPMYEDLDEGRRSLRKLAGLEFAVACFGHGKPILSGASEQFRQKWAAKEEPSHQVA